MSSATINTPTHRSTNNSGGVNFMRVLKSEWIKITTVPSTVILLAITVLVMVGLAALGAWSVTMFADMTSSVPEGVDMGEVPEISAMVASVPGSGLIFGQLLIASLAVVLIASEWGTGMIRSTMVAVPGRIPALLAKQLVFAVIAFLVGAGSAFLGYLVAQPILATADLTLSLTDDGVLLHIINTGSVLALVAVLAMSIGTLIRNTAGGVVTSIGLLMVLPILLQLFSNIAEWLQDAYRFLPGSGGEQMVATQIMDGDFNQWQGALVLGAWALVLLVASLIVTKNRDV